MSELREIIREVIAKSDDLSVESLTIQTLSRITDSERARLFAESVPAVVASELHNTRFACRLARPGKSVQTIRSAKVAAIRDDWRRKLDAVYQNPRLADHPVLPEATRPAMQTRRRRRARRWVRMLSLPDRRRRAAPTHGHNPPRVDAWTLAQRRDADRMQTTPA